MFFFRRGRINNERRLIILWCLPVRLSACTLAVRKVSSHFEYLENRSCGLDVTWQPVRGDLTAHPRNNHSPVGLVNQQWDAVYWACVLCDRRIHNHRASWLDKAPAHSKALMRYIFLAIITTPRSVSSATTRFGCLRLLTSAKAKFAIERKIFVIATVRERKRCGKTCLEHRTRQSWGVSSPLYYVNNDIITEYNVYIHTYIYIQSKHNSIIVFLYTLHYSTKCNDMFRPL
jgi:hypothetical protein